MTYTDILADRINRREITFPQAIDFLVAHGIHELAALRMLSRRVK